MRRILWLGVLFLAGCANIDGPFAYRPPERVDDPRFTIPEQQARGRDRLAQPDPSPYVAPPITPVFPRPSPTGS